MRIMQMSACCLESVDFRLIDFLTRVAGTAAS